MDSGFLNVFCEDSYISYDNDIDYWPSNNVDTLGLQLLTETLEGILPIPPTENFHINDNSNISINTFKYDDDKNEGHFTGDGRVELMTINTHAGDYDTDNEDNVIYYHDYEDDNDNNADGDNDDDDDDDDQHSQCSYITFKTGSVSSSIGDYESHSSDCDNFDEVVPNKSIVQDKHFMIKSNIDVDSTEEEQYDNFIPVAQPIKPFKMPMKRECTKVHNYKPHGASQLVITTDTNDGGLGLNIDANNFDLAEFITEDDIMVNPLATSSLLELSQMGAEMEMHATDKTIPLAEWNGKIEEPSALSMDCGKILIMSSENCHSDTDSDIIVDVETVESNEDDSTLFANRITVEDIIVETDVTDEDDIENIAEERFIDNIKEDPSWTPSKLFNKKSDNNASSISEKCIQHTKKGRRRTSKNQINNAKKVEGNAHKKYADEKGKNSMLRENNMNTIETIENIESINQTIKTDQENQSQMKLACNSRMPSVKRKLNLEEYKKRRCDEHVSRNDNKTCTLQSGIAKTIKLEENSNSIQKGKVSHHAHSAEVISIVKSLKEEQQQQKLQQKTKAIDPITIAKEKVLRMQELKKAQQLRIIDSTISAKVPKVTKLPLLEEIVKNTEYDLKGTQTKTETEQQQQQKQKKVDAAAIGSREMITQANHNYEEIITISIRCNTDISIPPSPFLNDGSTLNKATQSLLKSTVLLSNVTKAKDNAVLTVQNSLIASIQDVVVKKVVHENQTKCSGLNDNNEKYHDTEHHGEDKIIMHLRKDRIRPTMCTVGVQTDYQTPFSALSMLNSRKTQKYRRKKTSCKSNGGFRYASSDQLADSAEESDISQARHNQSRENSCSSSLERVRIYDSAIGTGYSSRGSCRNRSSISSSYSESYRSRRRQRRTSYKQRQRKNSRSRSSSSSSSSSNSSSSSCSSSSSSSTYTSTTAIDSSDYEHSHTSRHAKYKKRSSSPFCSRSRSRSRTRSRSKSNSRNANSWSRNKYKGDNNSNSHADSIYQPAVEERRIVYVGRIEQETTKDMLRKKFSSYGNIKQISFHYKENGMKYGFVTYKRAQDAFAAIDNSVKDPKINMYDVSFGGRRAFCRSTYADLDNAGINTYHSYVYPTNSIKRPIENDEESFEALLKKMKQQLNAHKQSSHSNKDTNKI